MALRAAKLGMKVKFPNGSAGGNAGDLVAGPSSPAAKTAGVTLAR